MRSPSLLTGITGAVAVLVLVYVGLTAVNLQPHITFGDPKVQVASAVAPPEKPTAPPAVSSPAPAAVPGPSQAATAEPAPSPTSPPPQGVGEPAGHDAGSAPPVTVTAPPAPFASTGGTAPVPTASADMPPSVPAAPAPPPVVAAPAPEPAPAPAPSMAEATAPTAPVVASPPPGGPPIPAAPDAASPPPAEPERTPPVAAAEPPQSQAEERVMSERMAPSPSQTPPTPPVPQTPPTPHVAETPPTPPTPLVASVPTPLARPKPPAEEKLASAEPSPSDASRQATAGPATPPNDEKSPTQSAALAPQPEKSADDRDSIEQPNGALKPVDLARPLAERAGILTVGGRSVQLAGIVPTDPERSCTGPNGKEWPCGTLARTALRTFLLGRTITCDVPDPEWKGSVTADCRFARVNLGDWLARNGWAEVASGSPFASAADEARKAGLGVYGNDPRKKHQSTLAPTPPKEDPLNPI